MANETSGRRDNRVPFRASTKTPNIMMLRRTRLLLIVCGILAFAVLGIKLFSVMIIHHDEYEKMAIDQQVRETEITASRGAIYDTNGKILAMNASVDTIFISPAEIAKNNEDPQLIARELSEILDVDYDKILSMTKNTDRWYEVVKRKVEPDVSEKVRAFKKEKKLVGVKIEPDTKRYYPYGSLAAHVIGFVGQDNEGRYGLEQRYDSYLTGSTGRIIRATDNRGTDMLFVNYEDYYDETKGNDMNLTIDACQLPGKLELEDKWILSKLNRAIREITENMDRYELGVAAQKIYDFIWDDYCDWYIELTKTRLQGEDEDSKIRAQQVLCHVLTQMLKLLHPFMPFITEEIWQALPHEDGVAEGGFLMLQSWPVAREALDFPEEEKAMELIMDLIRAVRTRRSEMNVPPSKKARLTVATAEEDTFRLGEAFLKKLAYASEVDFVPVGTAPEAGSVTVVTHAAQASMPMAELVDLEKEKARMEKELKKNSAELQKLETKLQNPGFVNKAPEHVVKAEQERAVQLRALVAKLEEQLQGM